MEEKLYYQDENIKVTNLRITCNHVTIPIDKIDHVNVDFKVTTMIASFMSFLFSFIVIGVLCYFYGNWGYLGIVLLVASFVWYRMVYRSYVELKLSTGSREVRLWEASMGRREYIYRVEEALKGALIDHIKEKELSFAKSNSQPAFSASETVILKRILLEYDKNNK